MQGKVSEAEVEERTQLVIQLLAVGMLKSDIKRVLKQKYDCGARAVEDYLSRARLAIRQEHEGDVACDRAESLLYYLTIASNAKLPVRDRIRARARYDDIMGFTGHRVGVHVAVQTNVGVQEKQEVDSDYADEEYRSFLDACQTEEELEVAIRVAERKEAAKQARISKQETLPDKPAAL